MNLKGAFTAMITPFREGRIDEEGFAGNIQRQLDAGIAGMVLLGTTGEDVTLSLEEQQQVIELGVKMAKGKALVIVGTGSNSTQKTIENTRRAKTMGADAALVVTPYYNKPTQEGLYRHFEAIAAAVDLPLIVYNIPGRTGVNIETPTLLRIAGLPHIAGVKECSANMAQVADVLHIVQHKYPSLAILSGDDVLTLPMMALGASGIISVVSNLVPKQVVAQVRFALDGQFDRSRKIHQELLPLVRAAFWETNPIPIKHAMHLCGLPAGGCRLPLCELGQEHQHKLAELLASFGLS